MSAPGKRVAITLKVDGEELAAAVVKAADDLSGSAADRERYVNERAQFLARAFVDVVNDSGPSQATSAQQNACFCAFRELIDKGVLR